MLQKEMTIPWLLALTLLPSAIFTALYYAIGCVWQGLPSMALFIVLAILTLFPFEIYVLMSANKREYGKYGLKIAFARYEKMAWWKIAIYGAVLFGFAGIISVTVAPLENSLMTGATAKLNELLPAYFNWTDIELAKQYPRGILILTSVLYVLMNAFICPTIEEMYFRGYLTNKLDKYGIVAPILVTLAFSLYHWWLPFNNIFRICFFVVASIIVYKKKNIYISMVFHTLCNLFSSISFVMALLG